MNYTQSVEYIHSLLRFGIRPGLERITKLLELLDNPQEKFKTIHVAGTNGKGSSCTMMANILEDAGFKTGLYTSPYVLDFRERIKLNSEMITKDALANCVSKVKEIIGLLNKDGIEITEFEAITAAALLYFANENCDYAVIEVGLGGRFDATNVLKNPRACIITSISLDHTNVLGDSIPKIALEKCGIIKTGTPVISSKNQKTDAVKVINDTANIKGSPVYLTDPADVKIISDIAGQCIFEYKGEKYTLQLNGLHQIENALNVIKTAKLLGIEQKAIVSGLGRTRMLARMEVISQKPLIIREGGHNEGCAIALKEYIQRYEIKNIHMVIGMMADKDVSRYIELIAPLCKRITAVTASNPRSMTAEQIAKIAKNYCNNVSIEDNPKKAYLDAVSKAGDDDSILVCGSFYLMSDIF